MIEINLENLKDVDTKDLGGNRCVLIFTDANGSKVEIITTKERGSWIYDSVEKVCVNKAYWYEEMQKELDSKQDRIDQLEEQLECTLSYEIAI